MLSFSSYFSVEYLAILLPITVGLYAILPQKLRRWVLLLASYTFFWAMSKTLIVYLLLSTVAIYVSGILLSKIQESNSNKVKSAPKEQQKELKKQYLKKERAVLAVTVLYHIGVLLVLKYSPFVLTNVNSLFELIGLSHQFEIPKFMQPIGISFYTFQAVSYLFDVYRKKIPADYNLMRLAMYMSFFPQLMEGPICRYTDTVEKLWEAPRIQYKNFIFGAERILYGLMKKVVVADRLNLFIKNVFTGYEQYDGFVIAVAGLCYTFQLYMDFSGTMDLVIGSAQIFGIVLPENFRQPFFSTTISEFWQRWHITLGTWFKDYIFYPLSMSKPLKKLTSKARKKIGNHFGPLLAGSIALFCVWFSNGVWHGAGWNYIFFGMFHFVLILGGSIVEPFVIRGTQKFNIRRDSRPYRLMQTLRTVILVCIGELFFRAETLTAGFAMFSKIFTDFELTTLQDGTLFSFGMDEHDFVIILVMLCVIFVIGYIRDKGISIREKLAEKHLAIQFVVFYALILCIVIFGAYGSNYLPVDPIYANF